MKAMLLIGTALLVMIVGFVALRPDGRSEDLASEAAPPDPEHGVALYAEHCAACHGADLEGAPNWRSPGPDGIFPAPPHDASGHTWHHDDALLFAYTKLGGAETMARAGVEDFASGMPGFGETLSDDEIRDVLAFIKSRWPAEIRAAQAERTAATQ
jgi:mono/diheme cytochrome c family protein